MTGEPTKGAPMETPLARLARELEEYRQLRESAFRSSLSPSTFVVADLNKLGAVVEALADVVSDDHA